MNKSIIYNKNRKILTVKGGALIYETYPDSDAGKKKIEGVRGVQYFSALWKYFIKIYNKTPGKKNEIINKLSIDTIDILNCFDSSNNMLKLDFEYLGYSITLQVINNSNEKLLIYYIIINFKDLHLHLTIHFNRKYDNVRHSKASVISQEQTEGSAKGSAKGSVKGSAKGSVMTGISDISKTSSHTEMMFSDNKSILTPIHLTSDTKHRSYYISIERIDDLIQSLIELMPEGYDKSLYLNTIIPGVFIGSFCSDLVYLFTSSFIINRIVKKIDDKLNRLAISGQNLDIKKIIEDVKRDIDEEKIKIKDTNDKLYNSLDSISGVIDFIEVANINDIRRHIKSLLFGIEGFKDINTFLYDTGLIRGNDGTIRNDTEFQNLRTFFSNQQTFLEYCNKYYNNKRSDCEVANYKAKDIMGNVVDILSEDNVIALIGNLALKAFIDTIDGLNTISANESIIFLLQLSDEIFVMMDMQKEQYKDVIHLKKIFVNLKNILIKWKKYKTELQIPLAISPRESSQQPSISEVSQRYPQEQPSISEVSQRYPQEQPSISEVSQRYPQEQPSIYEVSQRYPQEQHDSENELLNPHIYPQRPLYHQDITQQSRQFQQLPPHFQQYQQSRQFKQLPPHFQQSQQSQQSQQFQQSEQLPYQSHQFHQSEQLPQQSQQYWHSQQLPPQFQQLPQHSQQLPPQFQQLPPQFQQLQELLKILEFSEIRMKMLQDIRLQKINILKTSNSFDEEIIYDDIFNINNDISLLDNYINNIRKNIQGLQRYGGSKNVSKVINRYLDKIKEIRGIIKELNDNKKKNKSKILTKRMQIKNLFTKIKIQREKEKEKEKEKKKQRNKAKNTKKAG
jgi:hypothetical protein